jgi:glycosyltransferase involved in cell wall biosynthesis
VRVVIDGLAIRGENSLSIVSEHLLSGWQGTGHDDEIHLVLRSDAALAVPESVSVHRVRFGRNAFVSRVRAQSFGLPALCRRLRADVMLGLLPATTLAPLPCPHAVVAWDFRYRLRPRQFGWTSLVLRRMSYGLGFRQTDAVACISERTRRDLLRFHKRLSRIPVRVAHLGADHVTAWPPRRRSGDPYALAFGHFTNKNVGLVLDAWAAMRARGTVPLPLRLVGVPEGNRRDLEARVEGLGLGEVVTVRPWLDLDAFREEFASSRVVVFPSDFEGFGLPAVEAMRLGIPLVITPEPALLEVTDGRAVVVEDVGPDALARAVDAALVVPEHDLVAATGAAARFTWASCASAVRALLVDTLNDHHFGLPA